MTPSQTQALQSVKDEVAKKYGFENWKEAELYKGNDEEEPFDNLINEAIELYHTRLLAEAGRELPDDDKIDAYYQTLKGKEGDKIVDVINWLKLQASALLAAKQAEVEGFAKWVLENVLQLDEEDEWYSEGYRYRIYLSVAQSAQVKTFQEVYKHYKPQ